MENKNNKVKDGKIKDNKIEIKSESETLEDISKPRIGKYTYNDINKKKDTKK